ncbi:glycosyltransferase [Leucobacter muris]|uniref:D-inositol 3-phosphate glycosyltransferase n=1 Tax=Leucobacter muris TaxID=1935379 RepID=A0ABX5QCV9_9MICO|nr:glycosyltransferase [Leucobacter muris]QAB16830.1 glycosyltransferase [Leucobacter muris]
MRVVIVSRIYRPEPAAASLFLGCVADALREQGVEVEVLTAKPLPGQGDGSRGERIRTFPVMRDRSGYVRGYVQYMSFDVPLLFRLLFARRPAVVFVEPPPTTGAVVRLVCAIRRIPYVYDAADIWADAAAYMQTSPLVVRVLRRVERFALRGARALVTISQGVADRVRSLGVRTPTTVSGFGADTLIFRYVEAPTEPVFLYAGTYTELHGASILISAFARFSETHAGYRLRFIGNGTGQDEMRHQARILGVELSVDFVSPIPAAELQPEFARAVASLSTQFPEPGYRYAFTSKIYSSLAVGCPVIFAGPGPTGSFIDQAAEQIEVGCAVDYEIEAIADAMRKAADHPLPAERRRALAEWTAEHHSMSSVAAQVAGVIADTARESGRDQRR